VTAIRVERAVAADVEEALAHFWSIERLREGWSAITGFEILHESPAHQEARMTVRRDGCTERIRTIRMRRGRDIEMFTPEPPPMMSWHRGAWRFRPIEAGCLIAAEREYDLWRLAGETELALLEREMVFQAAFEERLGRILASFPAREA
jgi:hypothetical protein